MERAPCEGHGLAPYSRKALAHHRDAETHWQPLGNTSLLLAPAGFASFQT
jgi:hypothetical protein